MNAKRPMMPLPSAADALAGATVAWVATVCPDGQPLVFGAPFDGPMPGHHPAIPVHDDLLVKERP
jgi:hypothetical protein